MRPGPGLVVMALAFISGARRGSTSSISSKTTTTTTSSPPPPPLLPIITTTPSSSSSYLELFQTTLTSSAAKTRIISTSTSLPPEPEPQNNIYNSITFVEQHDIHHLKKRLKDTVVFNIINTFLKRDTHNSYPSSSSFFTYTYPLPSYLQNNNDETRTRAKSLSVLQSAKQPRPANVKFRRRRKRRTRSANINYSGSNTELDDTTENLNDSGETPTLLTTAVDSSSDRTTQARDLPVQFPLVTAAESSKSLEEDDIFALVAEEDLLSEESFDHLVKLTNDKIDDTTEEDYSSGTESIVESSSGSGAGALENVHDTPDQQNATEEDFVPTPEQQQTEDTKQQQQQTENPQILQDNDNNDSETVDVFDGDKEKPHENYNTERDIDDTVYNSNLMSNANEEIVLLNEADSIDVIKPTDLSETATTLANTNAELESSNRYKTILESNFALTRLNPWISACDLAQPGPVSAPDLQGKCLAGTLPVAWVDEGPGPPTCLDTCEKETPFTNKFNKDNMINSLINDNTNMNNNKQQHKNKNDNKLNNKLVGYTASTNTLNIKLRNSQPTISHSVNTNNNSNSNSNSNININNMNKHIDNNNKNINTFKNLIQKFLNPFNYYQYNSNSNNNNNNNSNNNNNNKNKMPTTKRNLNGRSLATSQHTDVVTTTNITNVTQKDEEPRDPDSQVNINEDYDVLPDMLMQQQHKGVKSQEIERNEHQLNDAAIATAAVAMQLNQQPQQNHNNNNIVKIKLTATTNYKDDNSPHSYQNHQYELKYNHLKHDHVGNSNNNKRHQSNNINVHNTPKRSNDVLTSPTATKTNNNIVVVAVNNRDSDQYLKMPPPEKQQLQCLEYLGDRDKTMPTQLCHHLTPSERLAQLRHLRLQNCCERNVYSALHTLALNATLSGGTDCLRVLEDLMALDAQAARITCGLSEILFRFDCRQVYSIIHQCKGCKEAYRRWVCSTLVPYFAETGDIMKPPEILTTTTMESTRTLSTSSDEDANSSSQSYKHHDHPLNKNTTTMASNLTTSHNTATLTNNNHNNNKNNKGTDTSSVVALKIVTSNFITNSNNNKHDMQYDATQYQSQQQQQQQQQEQEQHHVNKRNIQNKQHVNNKFTNNNNGITASSSSSNGKSNHNNRIKKINDNFNYTLSLIHHKNQTQQQQLHQFTNFITSSSPALTLNDIISHNSWLTSPKNFLRSTLSQRSINETNEPTLKRNSYHKSTNKRHKRSDNSTITTAINAAEAFAHKPLISLFSSSSSSSSSSSASQLHHTPKQKEQLEQQSFNFPSTANTEDSFNVKNPVITKLLRRSKRKEFEFRKRQRIRPCLSVCQTVEQKCPYLLPADRAPAMPTQYAGEPSFLCLDYNIAETEEQLKKASHGTNDCCYTYCSNTADGICTYCDDMWKETDIDKAAQTLSQESQTKVFNITMKTKGQGDSAGTLRVESKIQQKMSEERDALKMSTVAISVRNDTALENATRLAERLQYYAFCDGVFYYDADPNDMPEIAFSENCKRLPGVQTRCSIPYYASNYLSSAEMLGSYRKQNEAQKLLIWLSTLVCLWSCYSAHSLRMKRFNEITTPQPTAHHNHQSKQHKFNNTANPKREHTCQSCQTRDIMQTKVNSGEKIIEIWHDYRESKVLINLSLQIQNGNSTRESLTNKKSLRFNHLINRHLRQIQHWLCSAAINLKILSIFSLIQLISYHEIVLPLFKKRQKLRKRKQPTTAGVMALRIKSWSMLRVSGCRSLKILSQACSLNTAQTHYYSYYYYCSPIFSCSDNKMIKYNYYNNNESYLNRNKYNFKICNFNNKTKHSNNNSSNNNNSHMNKMFTKLIDKTVSIIKSNTNTTTTTHTLILKLFNTKPNNNKFNSYKIMTFININYNIYNNNNNNNNNNNSNNKYNTRIFNSLSPKPNCSPHHHYYYYDNYSDYNICYNNYYKTKFKSNKKYVIEQDNNVLLQASMSTSTSTSTLNLTNTSTTITITFYCLFQLFIIFPIIWIFSKVISQMLIMFIMPLFFKTFIEMIYNNNNNSNNNNNHHMKNIITSKLKISFSPKSSFNSKKTNYRYFYNYNFNINDWWQRRRWWRRKQHHLPQQQIVKTSIYNVAHSRQFLLLNDLQSPANYCICILL